MHWNTRRVPGKPNSWFWPYRTDRVFQKDQVALLELDSCSKRAKMLVCKAQKTIKGIQASMLYKGHSPDFGPLGTRRVFRRAKNKKYMSHINQNIYQIYLVYIRNICLILFSICPFWNIVVNLLFIICNSTFLCKKGSHYFTRPNIITWLCFCSLNFNPYHQKFDLLLNMPMSLDKNFFNNCLWNIFTLRCVGLVDYVYTAQACPQATFKLLI